MALFLTRQSATGHDLVIAIVQEAAGKFGFEASLNPVIE